MLISGILLIINDWFGSFGITMGVILLFLLGIYVIFHFFFVQFKNLSLRTSYEKSISDISKLLIITFFFIFPLFPHMIVQPLFLLYVFVFTFFEGFNLFMFLLSILIIFSYYSIVHFLFIQSKGWKERNFYQKIITVIAIAFMTLIIFIELKDIWNKINW
jgi:hypothetical protein